MPTKQQKKNDKAEQRETEKQRANTGEKMIGTIYHTINVVPEN